MTRLALVAGLLLALAPLPLAPDAHARAVLCTDLRSPSCEGLYCVDEDLDGYLEPEECGDVCLSPGCCRYPQPCPPPPEWS